MKEIMTVSVGQLNLMIKDLFSRIPALNDIYVRGEISNFKHHTSGHMYMSLKDETGVMRAVMFKGAASGLTFRPDNGMKIIARGKVSVYERDGAYQLYISSMEPDGKGDLHAAFEKLKKQLGDEGLFLEEHKKPIPKYPEKIGVITAPTGAAVRDIINVLSRRAPYADITLYPALVQGEGAKDSIVRGIEYFNKKNDVQVIIAGRGGGSIEDLWAFNEEIVARAIFESEIPIISAVGHETDFTIADFVADLRAPTPSAAAELAAMPGEDIRKQLLTNEAQLLGGMRRKIENSRLRVRVFSEKDAIKNPIQKINEKRMYLDSVYKDFENAVTGTLDKKKQQLAINVSKLDARSPLGTLRRGYAVVSGSGGEVIRSCSEVKVGDSVNVRTYDGQISATVTDTKAFNEN